jgi:hypothetical protein
LIPRAWSIGRVAGTALAVVTEDPPFQGMPILCR